MFSNELATKTKPKTLRSDAIYLCKPVVWNFRTDITYGDIKKYNFAPWNTREKYFAQFKKNYSSLTSKSNSKFDSFLAVAYVIQNIYKAHTAFTKKYKKLNAYHECIAPKIGGDSSTVREGIKIIYFKINNVLININNK